MKLILCIHVPGISIYKKVVFFCSSQIRTLVAMATFSVHRLIMGKVKSEFAISAVSLEILQKCLCNSPLCFIYFALIPYFDWLLGPPKGKFSLII